MKRCTLMLVFCCCFAVAFAQRKIENGYKKLPASFRQRDSLIRFIKPDSACTYWAFGKGYGSSAKYQKILFSKGIKPDSVKFKVPESHLLVECMPGYCYHYVVFIRNGKVDYITTDADFEKFIGHVDNLAEAVLLAEVHMGLFNYVDSDDPRGGSYKIDKQGFDLKLCHYELCPETKSSYHLVVSKDGKIEFKECDVYYTSSGCVDI